MKICFLKQNRSKIPTHSCSFQLKHVYNLLSFCLEKPAFLCPLFPLPTNLRAALETNLLLWPHHLWRFPPASLSYLIKFNFLQRFKCTGFFFFIYSSHVISSTFPMAVPTLPFVGFSYFNMFLIFLLLSLILSTSLDQTTALYLSFWCCKHFKAINWSDRGVIET